MDRQYQLLVTDDGTEINVNTIDPTEIARIVSLAGIQPSPTTPAIPAEPQAEPMSNLAPEDLSAHSNEVCSVCGEHDHDENNCPQLSTIDEESDAVIDEDMAKFDYGQQDIDDEGHEVDVDTYMYHGPKLPQRIVKGGQGDNSLISEIHRSLVSKYNDFLAEDRENDDGIMSPLSDPTKPEFDKDPLSGEETVDDGSRSPMSAIKRQPVFK